MIFRIIWLLWKNRLTKSFCALLNSENPIYELYFVGIGNLKDVKETKLISGEAMYFLHPRSRLLLANIFHARSELVRENLDGKYPGVTLKMSKVLKRAISIGIYSRNLSEGLFNGFTSSLIFKRSEIVTAPFLSNPKVRVRFSRMSASIGCIIPKLETDLEVEIRRNDNLWDLQFLESYLTPYSANRLLRVLYRKCFPFFLNEAACAGDITRAKLICVGLPGWHYVRSFFTIHFSEDLFHAKNIYRKAFLRKTNGVFSFYPESVESKIHWSSNSDTSDSIDAAFSIENIEILDARYIVVSEYLLPDDTTLIKQCEDIGGWPHSIWTNSRSAFVAVPNHLQTQKLTSGGLLFPCNSNWAHFMEEILPRLVLAEGELEYRVLLTPKIFDEAQAGAIDSISKSKISIIEREYKYSTDQIFCTVHENRRSLAILKELNGKDLVDQNTMRIIRSKATQLIAEKASESSPICIYIQRNSRALRKLVNRNQIETLLESKGFIFLRTEELSYVERIRIFQKANLIVSESGAGGANLHFCNMGTKVIELRHPGMVLSEEETTLTASGRFEWTKIEGKNGNVLHKVFKGTDCYSINLKILQEVLQQNIPTI